jgi:esterase/lipase superfamily enzyme
MPKSRFRRGSIVLAVAIIVLAGCAGPSLVSAPNLYVDSPENPYASVPAELRTTSATVVYATDRQIDPESPQLAYCAKRSRTMAFGLCTVTMGENASWEELATASTSRKRSGDWPLTLSGIDERGQFPALGAAVEIDGKWSDDPAYVEECQKATEQLHQLLAEQLAKTPYKELYVFVHGYNNTFESGTFRAAQIWHFVGRRGVPVLYSWPAGSPGLLRGYTRDRESGEFTNSHLKQFLRALASCPEVQKIHLIGHSRGTDVLGTAVRELHIEDRGGGRDTRTQLKLGQLVLAAPDIDLDVFIERFSADRVGFVAERLTIYVSANDKMVGLSNWLFGGVRRLGQLAVGDLSKDLATAVKKHPVMNIVEVRAKTDRKGHGYFLSSPAVLSDLILVLRDQKAPGAENGRPLIDQPDGFWEIRDGYPNIHAPDKADAKQSSP